jgi:hypothetical protein
VETKRAHSLADDAASVEVAVGMGRSAAVGNAPRHIRNSLSQGDIIG